MDDDVGVLGGGGDECGAGVVAGQDGDVGVGGCEGFRGSAEEHSDVVSWTGGCEGVQDGAAYVACSSCAGGRVSGADAGWGMGGVQEDLGFHDG